MNPTKKMPYTNKKDNRFHLNPEPFSINARIHFKKDDVVTSFQSLFPCVFRAPNQFVLEHIFGTHLYDLL
jgi:hypothetical protein